jgi:hypothetical protein
MNNVRLVEKKKPPLLILQTDVDGLKQLRQQQSQLLLTKNEIAQSSASSISSVYSGGRSHGSKKFTVISSNPEHQPNLSNKASLSLVEFDVCEVSDKITSV